QRGGTKGPLRGRLDVGPRRRRTPFLDEVAEPDDAARDTFVLLGVGRHRVERGGRHPLALGRGDRPVLLGPDRGTNRRTRNERGQDEGETAERGTWTRR